MLRLFVFWEHKNKVPPEIEFLLKLVQSVLRYGHFCIVVIRLEENVVPHIISELIMRDARWTDHVAVQRSLKLAC